MIACVPSMPAPCAPLHVPTGREPSAPEPPVQQARPGLPPSPAAQEYAGFNLVFADLRRRSCAYLCNSRARRECQAVGPGMHGLSNHCMDDGCSCKLAQGKRQLQALMRERRDELDDALIAKVLGSRGCMGRPGVNSCDAPVCARGMVVVVVVGLLLYVSPLRCNLVPTHEP